MVKRLRGLHKWAYCKQGCYNDYTMKEGKENRLIKVLHPEPNGHAENVIRKVVGWRHDTKQEIQYYITLSNKLAATRTRTRDLALGKHTP